jgi:hypothetical protein
MSKQTSSRRTLRERDLVQFLDEMPLSLSDKKNHTLEERSVVVRMVQTPPNLSSTPPPMTMMTVPAFVQTFTPLLDHREDVAGKQVRFLPVGGAATPVTPTATRPEPCWPCPLASRRSESRSLGGGSSNLWGRTPDHTASFYYPNSSKGGKKSHMVVSTPPLLLPTTTLSGAARIPTCLLQQRTVPVKVEPAHHHPWHSAPVLELQYPPPPCATSLSPSPHPQDAATPIADDDDQEPPCEAATATPPLFFRGNVFAPRPNREEDSAAVLLRPPGTEAGASSSSSYYHLSRASLQDSNTSLPMLDESVDIASSSASTSDESYMSIRSLDCPTTRTSSSYRPTGAAASGAHPERFALPYGNSL